MMSLVSQIQSGKMDALTQWADLAAIFDPLQSVPGLRTQALKAGLIRKMTQASSNNLSCVSMDFADKPAAIYIAEKLQWDTEFFGFPIAKIHKVLRPQLGEASQQRPASGVKSQISQGSTEKIDALSSRNPNVCASTAETFFSMCKKQGIHAVFSIVDVRDIATLQELTAAGAEVIETRLTYHRSLGDFTSTDRFATRVATAEDIPSLQMAAVEMVNPFDRFHADPIYSKDHADRLMAEWIRASITGGYADGVLVPDAPAPKAFYTYKLGRQEWELYGVKLAQYVLSAVHTEFRGWHLKLVSELNHLMKSLGAEHGYTVTQATNSAVIRNMEKLGFRLGGTEIVVRKDLRN
jgi:hypothetical protein